MIGSTKNAHVGVSYLLQKQGITSPGINSSPAARKMPGLLPPAFLLTRNSRFEDQPYWKQSRMITTLANKRESLSRQQSNRPVLMTSFLEHLENKRMMETIRTLDQMQPVTIAGNASPEFER